jgi:hypothetical protein
VIVTLVALSACTVQLGFPEDDAAALAILMDALTPPAEERIAFEEERQSPLFDEALTVRGYLERTSDGALVKVVEEPVAQRLTLGRDFVAIESAERTVRTPISRYPALAGLRSGLVGLIDRDGESLLAVFAPSLEEAGDGWRLELSPRDRKLARRLARLVARGCGGELASIEVWQGDGTVETMRFGPSGGGSEE